MSKVIVDGEEIELCDELENGEKELDTMDGFPEIEDSEDNNELLENTMDLEEIFDEQ